MQRAGSCGEAIPTGIPLLLILKLGWVLQTDLRSSIISATAIKSHIMIPPPHPLLPSIHFRWCFQIEGCYNRIHSNKRWPLPDAVLTQADLYMNIHWYRLILYEYITHFWLVVRGTQWESHGAPIIVLRVWFECIHYNYFVKSLPFMMY